MTHYSILLGTLCSWQSLLEKKTSYFCFVLKCCNRKLKIKELFTLDNSRKKKTLSAWKSSSYIYNILCYYTVTAQFSVGGSQNEAWAFEWDKLDTAPKWMNRFNPACKELTPIVWKFCCVVHDARQQISLKLKQKLKQSNCRVSYAAVLFAQPLVQENEALPLCAPAPRDY